MFPDELFVRFLVDDVVGSGPWSAIAAPFKASNTLLGWLTAAVRSEVEIPGMFSMLFSQVGLAEVYQRLAPIDSRPNIELSGVITPARRARVLESLEDLGRLTAKYAPNAGFDVSLLRAYLRTGSIDGVSAEGFRNGSLRCWSHGDLHGRNVLITTSGPRLIDPANVQQMHWAADIARLIIDLFMSGWDKGDASHEWNAFQDWFKTLEVLLQGEAVTAPSGSMNWNIAQAVNWLRMNACEIHGIPKTRDWEFRLALGVELLRAAYRQQELPTPKRGLGLAGACMALRQAKAAATAGGSVLE